MSVKSYYKRKKHIYYPVKNKYQNIVYFLSKWEVQFAQMLDSNPNVEHWTHDFPIHYYDKFVSKKKKVYLIDFFVKYKNGEKVLIEVKPKFALKPKTNSKSSAWKAQLIRNYLLNQSKWKAAINYCKIKNWKFYIAIFDKKKWEFIELNEDFILNNHNLNSQ